MGIIGLVGEESHNLIIFFPKYFTNLFVVSFVFAGKCKFDQLPESTQTCCDISGLKKKKKVPSKIQLKCIMSLPEDLIGSLQLHSLARNLCKAHR